MSKLVEVERPIREFSPALIFIQNLNTRPNDTPPVRTLWTTGSTLWLHHQPVGLTQLLGFGQGRTTRVPVEQERLCAPGGQLLERVHIVTP